MLVCLNKARVPGKKWLPLLVWLRMRRLQINGKIISIATLCFVSVTNTASSHVIETSCISRKDKQWSYYTCKNTQDNRYFHEFGFRKFTTFAVYPLIRLLHQSWRGQGNQYLPNYHCLGIGPFSEVDKVRFNKTCRSIVEGSERIIHFLTCQIVVKKRKFRTFTFFCRGRVRLVLKCVPHVQHDYSSSFDQSY